MAAISARKSNNGTTYRVRIRVKGHQDLSKTFKRKTDAHKWAQATESAIHQGRYLITSQASKYTFDDLLERYKASMSFSQAATIRNRKIQLQYWSEKLGFMLLKDITASVVLDAKTDLLTTNSRYNKARSPATVNRYLAALSHIFSFAVNELQWIDQNPLSKVRKEKEPRGRDRFLSDDEREALITACKNSYRAELYPIVLLALSTGMRKGEIMNLQWSDIDFKNKLVIIEKTKNGEKRSVPLVSTAFDELRKLSRQRSLVTSLLFPSEKVPSKPLCINKCWKRALRDSKVKNFKFHDLRHSAASYLAMSGATPSEIAEVLGHKTLNMVKRYAHLSKEHLQGVVEKMNSRI